MDDLQEAKIKIASLEKELSILNRLLDDRQKVLNLIPPCSLHGPTCLSHASEWIINTKKRLQLTNMIIVKRSSRQVGSFRRNPC